MATNIVKNLVVISEIRNRSSLKKGYHEYLDSGSAGSFRHPKNTRPRRWSRLGLAFLGRLKLPALPLSTT
ncbi:hypothetical protein HaLaN_14154 [Haematococcus lacustris]|uniref:Uncharacterized protein n=1 Tax=Haematococcus lacustris TaxID=44745 RepID=A0A699Z5X3_HAELA|nr:hypothetical protein HaLaN_14154 [Haematococcus lacustris]